MSNLDDERPWEMKCDKPYPCCLCGQKKQEWYTPQEKEPPKDKPFLAKVNGSIEVFPYAVLKWDDGLYREWQGFPMEIEQWMEIPE